MKVCPFYLQGHCKFGDNCRNEHPGRSNPGTSRNPFAPLQNSDGRSNNGGSRPYNSRDAAALPFNLNKAHIAADLSNERPQWILSAYGPGRDAPTQLFGGEQREQSFEEMRLRHYALASQGNVQQAVLEAEMLVRNAETQMQTVLNDLDGAVKYILDGGNQHPNRIDICRAKGTNLPSQPANQSFVQSGPTQTPPATSFGRPSGATFGQPSMPNSNSSMAANPFAQASTFGQSSFGASSTPSSNPFASAAQPTNNSGSVANSFQQSSNQMPGNNPPAMQNPFGSNNAPSLNVNPFAQNNHMQSSAPSHAPNPFAQTAAPATNESFQAQQTGGAFATSNAPSFGAKAQLSQDARGRLASWNGMRVSYINDEPCYQKDNGWRRIWFPEGEPTFTNSGGLPDDLYDNALKHKYEYLRSHGNFEGNVMPVTPPRREWCDWNL